MAQAKPKAPIYSYFIMKPIACLRDGLVRLAAVASVDVVADVELAKTIAVLLDADMRQRCVALATGFPGIRVCGRIRPIVAQP